MTFKHLKFEDSATMRSLTKVAQDKGWIKEEPIVKKASPATDLNPTEDLTVNLLKLCSGLRTAGFEKQAEEIEEKFVNYKRANSLYGVDGEKGEDLVHAAHPKGSHKLENVDSKEAVFEDILDNQIKFMSVVDKKPTGKLASSHDIVGAVKTILAQNISPEDQKIDGWLNAALNIIDRVGNMVKSEMTVFSDFEMISNRIKQAATNPILDNLNEIVTQIGNMKTRLTPGSWVTLGLGGITQDTWSKVEPLLNLAIRYVNGAITVRKSENSEKSHSMVQEYESGSDGDAAGKPLQIGETEVASDSVIGKGADLINTLKAYQSLGTVSKNPAALNWVKTEIAEIQNVMQRYNSAEGTGKLDQVKDSLVEEMNQKDLEVKDFYTKAVKPRSA
jgi:hypothetical protein